MTSTKEEYFTLITGAGSGIGEAVAQRMESSGKGLILIGRTIHSKSVLFANTIYKLVFAADVCNQSEFDLLINQIPDQSIESILFSAGQNKFTPHRSISKSDLSEIFEVNTLAPIHNLSRLINKKKIRPGASILFMSSIAAQHAEPGLVAYAASKGAIEAAVRTLAIEYKGSGIRINALACGMIDTPLTRKMEHYYAEGLDGEFKKYPLKGDMDDVVNWIEFLLSDKSGWLTGQTITLDGGITIK